MANLECCTFGLSPYIYQLPDLARRSVVNSIGMIRQSGFFLFGAKSFALDGVRNGVKLIHESAPIEELSKKVRKVVMNLLYGGTLLLSGVMGIYAEASRLIRKEAVPHVKVVQKISHYFFIFSSIVALKINIDQYFEGKEISHSLHAKDQEKGRAMMESAVIGILSSLAYIIGSLLLLFELSTVLVIVLCGLGTTLAFTQMFHELFF